MRDNKIQELDYEFNENVREREAMFQKVRTNKLRTRIFCHLE